MNRFLPVLLILGLLALAGTLLLKKPQRTETTLPQTETSRILETSEENNFTAKFEIYTEGTKRIFTASMYHNQSEDAFIQNPDPSIGYVKRDGITWSDFFGTLPFKLEKDCLLTGTGQTFCNTETQKLHFTLNGVDTPDMLDLEIMPGDSLVVEYY